MKKNTLSRLPEDSVMQIILFLSTPTLIQLLNRSFRNQSQQNQYWKRLIREHFSTFATPDQLAEEKVPSLKKIYCILALFTKSPTPQALVQTELDTFLGPNSEETINCFPWACYIQGVLLLRSKNVSDNKRAHPLLKSAVENKFPGPSARTTLALAYRRTFSDTNEPYRLLLESAFEVDKHSQIAGELGRIFEFKLKSTSDENLKNSFRQSAIKWYENALDLLKDERKKEISSSMLKAEIIYALNDLHVPGSEGLFNVLNKHGLYNAIYDRYEDFTENKVITSSRKELHDTWLNEMRETKDVTSKQLCAEELLKMYQKYLAGPTDKALFDYFNVSQIKALEKECCDILGKLTMEEGRAEFNKNRVFQQQSGPPTPSTPSPSEDKCLIR